jgi:chromosomal replication initiation ATPase DnaA
VNYGLTAWEIVGKVCLAYHIQEEVLKARSRHRIATEARAVGGRLARESGSATFTEVGTPVNRDVGCIS